jgi:hypothetical protein
MSCCSDSEGGSFPETTPTTPSTTPVVANDQQHPQGVPLMCWFFTGPSTFLVDQSTEAGRGLRCFLWRLEKDKEIEF